MLRRATPGAVSHAFVKVPLVLMYATHRTAPRRAPEAKNKNGIVISTPFNSAYFTIEIIFYRGTPTRMRASNRDHICELIVVFYFTDLNYIRVCGCVYRIGHILKSGRN